MTGITPATGGLITVPPPVTGGAITPLSGTGRTVSPANGFSLRGRVTPPSLPGGIVAPPCGRTTSGTVVFGAGATLPWPQLGMLATVPAANSIHAHHGTRRSRAAIRLAARTP